jgi:tRNA-binding EMAP/Myf-like protein
MIDYATFEMLDLRVGTIRSAKNFPEVKKTCIST